MNNNLTPKKEILRINESPRGTLSVNLPTWAWIALYKKSKIRSRKGRYIKKAVKRLFHLALMEYCT